MHLLKKPVFDHFISYFGSFWVVLVTWSQIGSFWSFLALISQKKTHMGHISFPFTLVFKIEAGAGAEFAGSQTIVFVPQACEAHEGGRWSEA